ncbi:hypothetical protein Rsub_10699 [Raphidocelis subcapitata]|uniref:Lipoyl-binding domain-containing protein n=1 Tax=Raphidocelis subcapitata TaxID=307507 RepID=A0A2V0PFA3_9CHLO|nr:hypothetical protein Rsub_10699 [Raphidocelis subcapitata]|eukprot:GBF98199.1 hypothetical protein Rsub_10699 [Raphidocelis subcapitata]
MLVSRLAAGLARLGSGGGPAWGAAFATNVVVPALGESVTDGTLCAVLKRAGDPVRENDVIAQIETDKVTIDIKAPCDGTVLGILVKPDDTVIPGQLIATVDQAAAPTGLFTAAPAAAAPAAAAPAAAGSSGGGAAAAAAAAAHGRVPGIKFPPRATPDGIRISSLPAAEAASWQQQAVGGGGGGGAPAPAAAAHAAAAAAAAPAHAAHAPPPPVSASAAALGLTARAKVVTTRLKEQPARMRMTERELEAIMLGGATD